MSLMSYKHNQYLHQDTYCDKRCGDQGCCGFIKEELIDLTSREDRQLFVESRGKNKISLRLRDEYLSVQPSGVAAFDASMPRQEATFVVEKLTDDEIALKSIYDKYLTTEKFGCFNDKPTFTASTRGRSEIWKVKCKNVEGKDNEMFMN